MARLWDSHNLAARARASRRRRLLGENAVCADCKEDDPVVLKRMANGEVLCLRCRALRVAPAYQGSCWSNIRLCTICGYVGPMDRENSSLFEQHHTAGRANLPEYTTLLCKNCHAKVTATQRTSNVDVRVQPNQQERYRQSLRSAAAEVTVALTCTLESEPANWWQGFKRTLPALGDAAVAMLLVVCPDPAADEP